MQKTALPEWQGGFELEGITMHRFIWNNGFTAVLALALLAGCGNVNGGDVLQTGDITTRKQTETLVTETSAETETVTVFTATEIVTELESVVPETTVTETETETELQTMVTETEPIVTETEPIVTETEPVVTETEPVVTETEPIVTETEPIVTETEPPKIEVPPETNITSNGYSITVKDGITYVDGVLIANKTYALPETYNPQGLTSETYAAFIEMQSAASAEGLGIYVKSGFRSYYDQRYIYNGYVSRDGVAAADRYSARAGHSEHQSGMAIDVNSTLTSFKDTPEGIWLRDNCHLFGFIIRYPEGKESITGYMYEPWHIRYVGKDLAAKIKESGLCLEEYFGITSAYGY